jgi:hypothetical protein
LPFIHWLHNGKSLEDKPECHLSQLGPSLEQPEELQDQAVHMTGQLIINEVFPYDSGLYTCVAANKYGQVEVLGNVNISPKREFLCQTWPFSKVRLPHSLISDLFAIDSKQRTQVSHYH